MAQSDKALIERFLKATETLTQSAAAEKSGLSQKRISGWRAGGRAKLQARTRETLLEFLDREEGRDNGRVGESTPSYATGEAARGLKHLLLGERALFEHIVDEFRLSEGVRRQAGHVSIHGWVAGAKDYAEELGASEAVLDALEEWGKELRRREKERS